MSDDTNGAEEEAERDGVPRLQVEFQPIEKYLPGGEEVDEEEVQPGGGHGQLIRKHSGYAGQLNPEQKSEQAAG